jgi:hypothetical protein
MGCKHLRLTLPVLLSRAQHVLARSSFKDHEMHTGMSEQLNLLFTVKGKGRRLHRKESRLSIGSSRAPFSAGHEAGGSWCEGSCTIKSPQSARYSPEKVNAQADRHSRREKDSSPVASPSASSTPVSSVSPPLLCSSGAPHPSSLRIAASNWPCRRRVTLSPRKVGVAFGQPGRAAHLEAWRKRCEG